MNFLYESLIVIAIALIMIGFATILCFADRHYYLKNKEIKRKHYILKKSRFIFLLAYGMTWNWKSGIILKSTFWGTLGFYLYFLCFYLADMIYFIVIHSYLIIARPMIFITFSAIVPWIMAVVFCFIKAMIILAKKRTDA